MIRAGSCYKVSVLTPYWMSYRYKECPVITGFGAEAFKALLLIKKLLIKKTAVLKENSIKNIV